MNLNYIPRLSERQREVVCLVAQGYSNADIAERLCIALDTVKRHLSTIFEELGVDNRTQLAIWAFKHGLINLEEAGLADGKKRQIKSDKAIYQIDATRDQIVLLHSLLSDTKKIWIQCSISEYIDEYGDVQRRSLKKCQFCGKGSYDSANSIDHDKKCMAFGGNQDLETLKAQIARVLDEDE